MAPKRKARRAPQARPKLSPGGFVRFRGFDDEVVDPVGRDLDRQPREEWDEEPDVMPKGKTKADMCPHCFQIPASNGICGC